MFWETKLAELQKLATIYLTRNDGDVEQWTCTLKAGLNEPYHINAGVTALGETRAAAVCNMWSHVVKGGEPFMINLATGAKKFRWNARWEEIPLDPMNTTEAVTVEETADGSFDPAD